MSLSIKLYSVINLLAYVLSIYLFIYLCIRSTYIYVIRLLSSIAFVFVIIYYIWISFLHCLYHSVPWHTSPPQQPLMLFVHPASLARHVLPTSGPFSNQIILPNASHVSRLSLPHVAHVLKS
jgi:hypothetical protein